MPSFVTETLEVPAEIAEGTPVDVNPRSPVAFSLGGTLTSLTTKFQYSPVASGDVWFDVGSALTAAGLQTLPAGKAKRVRAKTTAFSSGAPSGIIMHDRAYDVANLERDFVEETIEAPAVASTAGAAVALEDGEQAIIHLAGSFTGTYQVQISLSPTANQWHDYGAPLTAAGTVRVPVGMAARVRLYCSAFTDGPPDGYLLRGASHESGDGEIIEAITAPGALSLFATHHTLAVDGSDAYTLADGLYEGQEKTIRMISGASSPVGTLTYNGNVTYVFWFVGQWLKLRWFAGDWVKVADYIPADRGIQLVSAPGAVSPYVSHAVFDIDGTVALTLADGFFNGQKLTGYVIAAANTPDGTLTPENLHNGTSIDLDAVGEAFELTWYDTDWQVTNLVGATVNA